MCALATAATFSSESVPGGCRSDGVECMVCMVVVCMVVVCMVLCDPSAVVAAISNATGADVSNGVLASDSTC